MLAIIALVAWLTAIIADTVILIQQPDRYVIWFNLIVMLTFGSSIVKTLCINAFHTWIDIKFAFKETKKISNLIDAGKEAVLASQEVSQLGQAMFNLTDQEMIDAGFIKGISPNTPAEYCWRKKS